MAEKFISMKAATYYAVRLLKYFAIACTIMLLSIVGAVLAWIFVNAIAMIIAVIGIIGSTVLLTIGVSKLYRKMK